MNPKATSRLLLMLLAGALTLGTATARHGADDPAGHNSGDDRGGTRQARGGGADDPAGHDAGDDKGGLNKAQRAALCQTAAVKADPGLWAKYECADDSRRSARPNNQLAKRGADDPPGDDHGKHGAAHAKLKASHQLFAKHGADDPGGDDRGQHGPGHA